MNLSFNDLKKRFSNIKLIVSDIDGTIISSKNEVGELTKQIVKKLKKKDILLSFASQRVHSSIVPIAEELDVNIPVISLNGALIQDKDSKIILNRSVIDRKYVEKALRLAEKFYLKIALCYNDRIVYTEDNSVVKDFMTRFGTTYSLVDSYDDYLDNVLEIIMTGNDRGNMKEIQRRMRLPFGMYLKVKYFRSQSFHGVFNVEITRKGISKKTGLKILSKYLKIKNDEILVFGDWYNDKELFEFGGTNIALDNAVDELKEMADYITDKSNEDDGVGHFLQKFYDNIN